MENYAGRPQKIGTLTLDKLSPYERGTVEQILFNISYAQEKYEEARGAPPEGHRLGRLERQEIDEARISARSSSCRKRNGRKAPRPSRSGSRRPRSRTPRRTTCSPWRTTSRRTSRKRWRRRKKPSSSWTRRSRNEGWLSMLSALYLQREEYREAIPVLQQLIAARAGQEDLLDAALLGLRPDGGLRERRSPSCSSRTTAGS